MTKKIKYSDQELFDYCQKLAETLGETPRGSDWTKSNPPLTLQSVVYRFGKWTTFLTLAGLEIRDQEEEQNVRKQELIQLLQADADENGVAPTSTAWLRDRKKEYYQATRLFDRKWSTFVRAANLIEARYSPKPIFSPHEKKRNKLFEQNIQLLDTYLESNTVTRADVARASSYHASSLNNHKTSNLESWNIRLIRAIAKTVEKSPVVVFGELEKLEDELIAKTKQLGPKLDLGNQVFGYLKALTPTDKRDPDGNVIWECYCQNCGNVAFVSSHSLLNGNTKTCGCLQEHERHALARELSKKNDGTNPNQLNSKTPSTNTSGFKGVGVMKNPTGDKKYRAYLFFKGKQIHGGSFKTVEEAIAKRKELEDTYFKPILDQHKKSPESD